MVFVLYHRALNWEKIKSHLPSGGDVWVKSSCNSATVKDVLVTRATMVVTVSNPVTRSGSVVGVSFIQECLYLYIVTFVHYSPFSVTTGFALCALVLPDNFEHYLNLIKAMNIPPAAILGCKTILAWPLCYHAANGIRHLVRITHLSMHVQVMVYCAALNRMLLLESYHISSNKCLPWISASLQLSAPGSPWKMLQWEKQITCLFQNYHIPPSYYLSDKQISLVTCPMVEISMARSTVGWTLN